MNLELPLSFYISFLFVIEAVFQFVIFNPLSYCFEGTIGFDVKASFASLPVSRLIRWYNKNFDKRLFNSTGIFVDWKLQTDSYQNKLQGVGLESC